MVRRTFLAAILSALFALNASAATLTYKEGGSWTVPAGVTSIVVKCYGKGGTGRSMPGTVTPVGAGGGGGYSQSTISVLPGSTWTIRFEANGDVAIGSLTQAIGKPPVFVPVVLAKGGSDVPVGQLAGGAGGQASAGIGQIRFSGGQGGATFVNAVMGFPVEISGGGGGAGATAAGNGANGANGAAGLVIPRAGYFNSSGRQFVNPLDGIFPGGGAGGGDNQGPGVGGGGFVQIDF